MDCRLTELPLPIKHVITDGVIYLNANLPWALLEETLEEILRSSNNISAEADLQPV